MTRVETIHQAIRHVYEAALAPDGWSHAGISVTEATGARKAIFLGVSAATVAGSAITTGFDAEYARRMQRKFETQPPNWVKAIPVGMPLRQTSFVSDEAFRRSEFYCDAVRPTGGFYGMLAPLVPDRSVYFVVGRDLGMADFSDEDVEAARLIVPHLTTALQVQNRLAAADLRTKEAYEVISSLECGVILLDARTRPIFANGRAEALAHCGDGLLLKRNEVSASSPADAQSLHDAIATAVRLNAGGRDASEAVARPWAPLNCYVSRRPPHLPLVIRVVPVSASEIPNGISTATRVILFVMEPAKPPEIDPSFLVATFNLTRREAMLAALLVRGPDLAEAASQLGIGLGTARGYLKQILAKTDTHRQTELVSLLLRAGMPIVR
ncbi:LuxR family transcriptional regulator [Burkholderia ubonensis]|uniref:helix-turn-helix transcriptional regulator n=1 Tax=Burkholderia ubonensis TaxID=101571 RepID=UPI00075ABE34|nr:helix-turn-helix transcriptional regulator [Burkholderia ubonensis]KVO67367.1 LuxR family transcriptional regulator [Burkholderia ubonensis]KVP95758.1 LuxR family transcriptional regulator [Burkholderia ubonensis]KWI89969.1 LuxR family transcriptional regulator [Burkholderia ubonensis]OJA87474.1 LuxR family transcriptional regulator [Burkholderia ubonensis]